MYVHTQSRHFSLKSQVSLATCVFFLHSDLTAHQEAEERLKCHRSHQQAENKDSFVYLTYDLGFHLVEVEL